MKATLRIMILLLSPFVAGHAQQTRDTHITSLQMPCYPLQARTQLVQGTARIKLILSDDGTVTSAEAVEGNPLLTQAAIENVRTWKFANAGNRRAEAPVVVFEYKFEDGPRNSCADRVIFESWNKVTVVATLIAFSD